MAVKIKEYKYFASKCCVFFRGLTTCRQKPSFPGCSGFTLVELIVVCAVLGVLATMAIPTMNEYIKTARNGACAAELRIIDKAITAFYIERNALPTGFNEAGLGAPLDPWKRPYEYYINSGVDPDPDALKDITGLVVLNRDYDLYSMGEDGLSNVDPDATTLDDIARSNEGVFVGGRP